MSPVRPSIHCCKYGLVRASDRRGAIRFLQETRGLPRNEAAKRVAAIAAELGIG